MAKYISQTTARCERFKLRTARRKLKIALEALECVASAGGCMTEGCACCTPLTNHESWLEHCDVGNAKVAMFMIKEVDR